MGEHRATEHADQAMNEFISKIEEYMYKEYREPMMEIIRLQLIEAYRQGWNDAEKFFDDEN
ncbi:hypothetical protein D3C80_2190320 [compost metagenome]